MVEKEITSIRIPIDVKGLLDEVSLSKEPYHATIRRLISENRELKEVNENYKLLIKLLKE